MRVLILSQYYAPEPIPKPVDLARELARLGHEVHVITGFPDYPSGLLYPGYKLGLMKKELIEGVPVVRTFEFPYHGTRSVGRFANYLSFMLSAPLALFKIPKVDVMYVWHPPLTIGLAAWLIAKCRRIPFTYDVQDIWPEFAVISGILKPGILVKCLSLLERFVYWSSNHLIVVTNGAKENLISKGVPQSKISQLPHWIDEFAFGTVEPGARSAIRARHGWTEKFVVLFAGNIGLVQGLETVLQTAAQLRARQDIVFVFLGEGSDKERLRRLVIEWRLQESVQFVNRQPTEEMPKWMSAADALLVHLKDSQLSNYVVPAKTMAYLAAGKPIIMAMHGAAADIVRDAKAGLSLAPENPNALAETVLTLAQCSEEKLEEFGRNGREHLRQHYSRTSVISKYVEILEQLIIKNQLA